MHNPWAWITGWGLVEGVWGWVEVGKGGKSEDNYNRKKNTIKNLVWRIER